MTNINRGTKITSLVLIGTGAILLILNIILGGTVNVTLPLVFLMMGGVFFILVFVYSRQWPWAAFLFIPGTVLIALGVIFLLNVLTQDWNAWAYAWLLLLAGLGLGLALASWYKPWNSTATLIGVGLTVLGVTLFALFGAIAGGLFIQIMAPILLALGGLVLFWLKPESILPERLLGGRRVEQVDQPAAGLEPDQSALPEPLSSRELEVLRLIDQGLSNPEIAERLTLAPSTIKTHINNLYGKLGVQTRVQALNRARELRLLE